MRVIYQNGDKNENQKQFSKAFCFVHLLQTHSFSHKLSDSVVLMWKCISQGILLFRKILENNNNNNTIHSLLHMPCPVQKHIWLHLLMMNEAF